MPDTSPTPPVRDPLFAAALRATVPKIRTCNLHENCDDADAKAKAAGKLASHCNDDCCEECYGY